MNLMVWGLLWATVGWLTGVLAFFTFGFAAHITDSPQAVNRAANYYSKTAMKVLGRAALVERGTSFDIVQTTSVADRNVDEFSIGGKTAHVSNEAGMLSTLHKEPLGLVPPPNENRAVYVTPEIAELGRVERQRQERNDLRDSTGSYQGTVALSGSRPTTRLARNAQRLIPGTRSLWDVDETDSLVEQSKQMFKSPETTELMILIVAYGVGALLWWLIGTQAGGAAPTGINIPGLGA